jgi:hypothetical protein
MKVIRMNNELDTYSLFIMIGAIQGFERLVVQGYSTKLDIDLAKKKISLSAGGKAPAGNQHTSAVRKHNELRKDTEWFRTGVRRVRGF